MATKYYHGTSKECAKQILSKGFNQELNNLFPCANISIEEEEGYPPLKDYILNMGYDGVKIIYDKETNDDEIVIYNPRWIQSMTIVE